MSSKSSSTRGGGKSSSSRRTGSTRSSGSDSPVPTGAGTSGFRNEKTFGKPTSNYGGGPVKGNSSKEK